MIFRLFCAFEKLLTYTKHKLASISFLNNLFVCIIVESYRNYTSFPASIILSTKYLL